MALVNLLREGSSAVEPRRIQQALPGDACLPGNEHHTELTGPLAPEEKSLRTLRYQLA
jgi:hypothetical protein